MKREEYEQATHSILLTAALIADLPLGEVRSAIDHAETLGPILDPTLMKRYLNDANAREALDLLTDLAELMMPIKRRVLAARAKLAPQVPA